MRPRIGAGILCAVCAVLASTVSAQSTTGLAAGAETAGHDTSRSAARIDQPFEIVDPGEIWGFATIRFDGVDVRRLRDAHERVSLLHLSGFPLPGGQAVDLELHPIRVFEPGARARVIRGDEQWSLEAGVAVFSGHVVGEQGQVFLAMSESMFNGFVTRGAEKFVISSGDPLARTADTAGTATITDARVFASAGSPSAGSASPGSASAGSASAGSSSAWCHAVLADGRGDAELSAASRTAASQADVSRSAASRAAPGETDASQLDASASPSVRVAEVIIEADDHFRARFTSDQEAVDYATTLVAFSSSIYRRDIGARLEIPDGYLTVWNSDPPWPDLELFPPGLGFTTWYFTDPANPKKDFPRAGAMWLSSGFSCPPSVDPKTICGGAFQFSRCDDEISYAWASLDGYFPTPLEHMHTDNDDLLVVMHEFGHIFGAQHTFQYNPPIECEDGTGPDSGTIMSYCSFSPPAGIGVGVAGVGLRFHPLIQFYLRTWFVSESAVCIADEPFTLGDYDQSGDLDPADLSILSGVLNQGFGSAGATEAFDMDRNDVLDQVDYDLLAGMVPWDDLGQALAGGPGEPGLTGFGLAEPGTLAVANLTDANPLAQVFLVVGLSDVSQPMLGGTLVPSPDLVLARTTLPDGTLHVADRWPNGLAPGTTLYFQYWIVDPAGPAGFSASNAISGTTP